MLGNRLSANWNTILLTNNWVETKKCFDSIDKQALTGFVEERIMPKHLSGIKSKLLSTTHRNQAQSPGSQQAPPQQAPPQPAQDSTNQPNKVELQNLRRSIGVIHIGAATISGSNAVATLSAPIDYPKVEENEQTRESIIADNSSYQESTFNLEYRVDTDYQEYLTDQRSDAFVVALLPYALLHGFDIEAEVPMSERLYFQLTELLIPSLSCHVPQFFPIQIKAPLTNQGLASLGKVGLAFSCGIDSFYSLHELLESPAEHYHPEFLTYMNVGSTRSFNHNSGNRLFQRRLSKVQNFASEYGYKVLAIDSNLNELLRNRNVHFHTFRAMSAILTMQKLLGVFYYSSGYTAKEFSIKFGRCAKYDLFSLPCFSTEDLENYSIGIKATRTEKVNTVSMWPPSYKHLESCLDFGQDNCDCEKCRRTRLGLYSLGRLERYSEVYNLEHFQTNFIEHIAFMQSIIDKGTSTNLQQYLDIQNNFIENGLSFERFMQPLERTDLEK
jgi:hypothetical protein